MSVPTGRWHRDLHRSVRHSLRHSLRWRLLVLFLVLALAMSAAFMGGMKASFSTGWRDAVLPLLSDYVDKLTAEIGAPPDVARAQALVARLPISIRIEGPQVQFDSHPKRRDHYASRRSDSSGSTDFFSDRRRGEASITKLVQRSTADGHRITFGLGDLDWHQGPGRVGLVTLAALLALIGLAYAYVRRLFKPLEDIGAGARRFGTGDFAQAIPIRRKDELGDLAAQINTMGGDIHQMLEAKRGLLLAISHELRSPLTRARLNTELLTEDLPTGEMRSALLRDLAEMARLIEDLLESERLASPHAALNLEAVDLGQLLAEVTGSFKARSGAAIDVSLAPGLKPLRLDRVRMRLLLRNLLDNALVHSQLDLPLDQHGSTAPLRIEIGVIETEGRVNLTVRDFGPGVSDDQLARLTEAFYRTDSARGRSTGGVGLGLYLCRLVAKAHGGQLALRNASPGLAVTVTLPRG